MTIIKSIKKFSYVKWIASFLLVLSSLLLVYTISWVDNAPYYIELIKEEIPTELITVNGLANDDLDSDSIHIVTGYDEYVLSFDTDLRLGKVVKLSLNIKNNTETACSVSFDLYRPDGYDQAGMQKVVTIWPGDNEVSVVLPFYRAEHPDTCQVRIFTNSPVDLLISRITIAHMEERIDGNIIIIGSEVFIVFVLICSVFAFVIQTLGAVNYGVLKSEIQCIKAYFGGGFAKTLIVVSGIVLIVILFCFRNVSLTLPFDLSGGDSFGVYYYTKMIDGGGITLVESSSGGLWGADMYDYTYSDTLSFLVVKFIGFFTDNPFLIINIFYFFCFFLAAFTCAGAMDYFGLDRAVVVVLSCLYGFTPYIMLRYGHMWLVPFFMMPIVCAIAIDIINDKVNGLKGESRERYFGKIVLLLFLCAFTGMYYAYFSCAMICVAWTILAINNKKREKKKILYPGVYLLVVVSGVLIQVIPNILYIIINGHNSAGELANRGRSEAEIYGLKLVQLLLPRPGHRIGILRELTKRYIEVFPLVNENSTASLGVIGSIGFLLALFLVFKKDNKHPEISWLTYAVLVIGTIGGISSVISVLVKLPVRCYNRMSVIIMFLALLEIGYFLNELKLRLKADRFVALLALILCVGLFDQTATREANDYSEYEATRNAIMEIDDLLTEDARIFVLPFHNWPSGGYYRSFYGYILSDKTLCWSYPAMQGREESDWQKSISEESIDGMVNELKQADYSGLYFDATLYQTLYQSDIESGSRETADDYVNLITSVVGSPSVVSSYGNIYFWEL